MPENFDQLKIAIAQHAHGLGFSQMRVSKPDLRQANEKMRQWLANQWHGEMAFLQRHLDLRANPYALHPSAVRVISVSMPYLDGQAGWQDRAWADLAKPELAVVSLYAQPRDYHRVMRKKLAALATAITAMVSAASGRACVDSAPVMEVEIASQAGLGWRGKHTLLLNRSGSMFFLGELLTTLPLPVDEPSSDHCGRCTACLDVCPTGALVAPYQLDARRCISYLTIELHGPIPERWRAAIGNRVLGCDDCQLVCPWNKFAQPHEGELIAAEPQAVHLLQAWQWDQAEFDRRSQGKVLRRLGLRRWRRNVAVALGNAKALVAPAQAQAIDQALANAPDRADALVGEHINWALAQTAQKK